MIYGLALLRRAKDKRRDASLVVTLQSLQLMRKMGMENSMEHMDYSPGALIHSEVRGDRHDLLKSALQVTGDFRNARIFQHLDAVAGPRSVPPLSAQTIFLSGVTARNWPPRAGTKLNVASALSTLRSLLRRTGAPKVEPQARLDIQNSGMAGGNPCPVFHLEASKSRSVLKCASPLALLVRTGMSVQADAPCGQINYPPACWPIFPGAGAPGFRAGSRAG